MAEASAVIPREFRASQSTNFRETNISTISRNPKIHETNRGADSVVAHARSFSLRRHREDDSDCKCSYCNNMEMSHAHSATNPGSSMKILRLLDRGSRILSISAFSQ